MRDAHGCVDHAKVIVNLRDGADGGARRARGRFLFDGDRRRKPFDHVDFGALHLVEKLPRVSRERLDVTALAFSIDGVESKRRFSRAGKTGDDREAVPGDFDADVLEVVLARAPDYQFGQAHETKPLPPQELACLGRPARRRRAPALSRYTEPKITSHNSRRERNGSRRVNADSTRIVPVQTSEWSIVAITPRAKVRTHPARHATGSPPAYGRVRCVPRHP